MHLDAVGTIRHSLPEVLPFDYYTDREAAWLLAQHMGDDASVRALKAGRLARHLDRTLLRPLVARSGGVVRRADVLALAYADRALRLPDVGAAASAALATICESDWHDFELTFDLWEDYQITRPGANLVVQMGFPSDHAALMGRYFRDDVRHKFEESFHPVRKDGRPTLAWARLDIDIATGEALIEEVQSDWLRFVTWEREDLEHNAPRSRDLIATRAYEQAVLARYAKLWPRALMLAVLMLLRDRLALRSVWMHTPALGMVLKGIWGSGPPRSLYTSLPKSFGFEATREVPAFLTVTDRRRGVPRISRATARRLRQMRGHEGPLFWRMQFD
ncbi:hypothetical protein [Tateyamaria sp. SN3-11]|uniref:hypothetical protein n=1 Tax=Tateyamaria sp. SN3-11 TaxID=3092147 RepID=UPI0039E735ED